jgi:hypothetical protein
MKDLTPREDPKAGQFGGGTTGNTQNGMSSTKKVLFQVVPVNIIVCATIIASAVGLYYKLDARIGALEKVVPGITQETGKSLIDRVGTVEHDMKELSPRIIETHTNVLWLMNQQKNAHP